ncbi:MAG: hypothetical protein AABY15_06530 [Nanoarchaeota archaeon]
MLVTLEQQEALIRNYAKSVDSPSQIQGFMDGVEKTMELLEKISARKMTMQELRETISLELKKLMSEDKNS